MADALWKTREKMHSSLLKTGYEEVNRRVQEDYPDLFEEYAHSGAVDSLTAMQKRKDRQQSLEEGLENSVALDKPQQLQLAGILAAPSAMPYVLSGGVYSMDSNLKELQEIGAARDDNSHAVSRSAQRFNLNLLQVTPYMVTDPDMTLREALEMIAAGIDPPGDLGE